MTEPIHIIGGGLAGSEAAWQVARRGLRAILHEMRPVRRTPAHQTDRLAELVCSNSLKSEQENSAPWLLKQELRRLESMVLSAAEKARVPGGHALTVDREIFSREVTSAIEAEPLIELRREEVTTVAEGAVTIIATGPLTSDALAQEIQRLTGSDRLFFYDSISPIVDAETVDTSIAYWASRYGKSSTGTDDYLNSRSIVSSMKDSWTSYYAANRSLLTSPRTTRRISKPACQSRRSRAAGAIRCASAL